MGDETENHDFTPYIQTITAELNAINDRVALLVNHRLSEGHFRESILRHVLARHVPESCRVGTGFVVTAVGASNEIDILVIDKSVPTVFKEGDLLIVTPESVRAIIEVKTNLDGEKALTSAADALAKRRQHASTSTNGGNIWTGLFVYESKPGRHEELLRAVSQARDAHGSMINAIALGTDTLLKFVPPQFPGAPNNAWHTFDAPELAQPVFISSLIEFLVNADMPTFAWFPPRDKYVASFHLRNEAGAPISKTEPYSGDVI